MAQEDQRVVERLAMHKILQSLSYENEIGSCNVAIVVSTNSNLVCHLLQVICLDFNFLLVRIFLNDRLGLNLYAKY